MIDKAKSSEITSSSSEENIAESANAKNVKSFQKIVSDVREGGIQEEWQMLVKQYTQLMENKD